MNATIDRQPTADERNGIAWWNRLTAASRAHWLRIAATSVPADAWAAFKRHADRAQLSRMRMHGRRLLRLRRAHRPTMPLD